MSENLTEALKAAIDGFNDSYAEGIEQGKKESQKEINKWKALARELEDQVRMALAYKLAMNITGLQSLEKVLAKAREAGL